ncbi:MAG: hypothetical protein ACM3TU_02240 [Bacillota bacterium]
MPLDSARQPDETLADDVVRALVQDPEPYHHEYPRLLAEGKDKKEIGKILGRHPDLVDYHIDTFFSRVPGLKRHPQRNRIIAEALERYAKLPKTPAPPTPLRESVPTFRLSKTTIKILEGTEPMDGTQPGGSSAGTRVTADEAQSRLRLSSQQLKFLKLAAQMGDEDLAAHLTDAEAMNVTVKAVRTRFSNIFQALKLPLALSYEERRKLSIEAAGFVEDVPNAPASQPAQPVPSSAEAILPAPSEPAASAPASEPATETTNSQPEIANEPSPAPEIPAVVQDETGVEKKNRKAPVPRTRRAKSTKTKVWGPLVLPESYTPPSIERMVTGINELPPRFRVILDHFVSFDDYPSREELQRKAGGNVNSVLAVISTLYGQVGLSTPTGVQGRHPEWAKYRWKLLKEAYSSESIQPPRAPARTRKIQTADKVTVPRKKRGTETPATTQHSTHDAVPEPLTRTASHSSSPLEHGCVTHGLPGNILDVIHLAKEDAGVQPLLSRGYHIEQSYPIFESRGLVTVLVMVLRQ